MEDKSIEPFVTQIMTGVAEALKRVMENENRSSFNNLTCMALLSQCLGQSQLLVKRRFMYNLLDMAKNEAILAGKKFTGGGARRA